jgi:glycosyltransferase involved in cell wall biosynthesis
MIRVLVVAEEANPEWVSVPLVGWSLAEGLHEEEGLDVHLVTQIRNRDAVLRAGRREGENVTFIDTEPLAAPLGKAANVIRMGSDKGWTTVAALNMLIYPYFERKVWREFGTAIQNGEFDIVHRVTPVTPTAVSSLATKCAEVGVPFIMGPINGGVPWPKEFQAEKRREREWLSGIRSAYKLLPGRRKMLKNSAAILVGAHRAKSEIPQQHHAKTFWLPENAVNVERFNRVAAPYTKGDPLRASFIGRLVPLKGVDMLLGAAAPFLRDGKLTLDIIGDGPMRPSLEAQVSTEHALDAVTFHGMVDHQSVQNIAAKTQIMVFPSIREFGGGAVLEAMALGVIPIVIDYAGPGELVDDEIGYKIPMGSRSEIIADLRALLKNILENPDVLQEKSVRARDRVSEHYTWTAKAHKVKMVYDWTLGNGPRPPVIL